MLTNFEPLLIRRLLGRGDWSTPIAYGPDGWAFTALDGSGSVIISCSPLDGQDWVHASIARYDRMPDYADLKMLHGAVYRGGWAYQVFAPPSDYVNIHKNALHLWGRLDGKPELPDFSYGSRSI